MVASINDIAISVDRNPSKFLLILRSALLRYISLPLASDLTDLTAQAASPWTPRLARVPMLDLWDAWVLFVQKGFKKQALWL